VCIAGIEVNLENATSTDRAVQVAEGR